MKMFENELVHGFHKSRYVASWMVVGGSLKSDERNWFRGWLKSLVIDGTHLTDDEVRQIYNYAQNGKLELQENAKQFREEHDVGKKYDPYEVYA